MVLNIRRRDSQFAVITITTLLQILCVCPVVMSGDEPVQCQPYLCDSVSCSVDPYDCERLNGSVVWPKESPKTCYCCSICVYKLGQGESCEKKNSDDGFLTYECNEGLKCDKNTHKCVNSAKNHRTADLTVKLLVVLMSLIRIYRLGNV